MFTREKKLIALLLSAALVLTMNTGLFAAVGAEDVTSEGAYLTTSASQTSSESQTVVSQSANDIEGYSFILSFNSTPLFTGKTVDLGILDGKLSISGNGLSISGNDAIKVTGIKFAKGVNKKTVGKKKFTVAKVDMKAVAKASKKDVKKALKALKKTLKTNAPFELEVKNFSVSYNDVGLSNQKKVTQMTDISGNKVKYVVSVVPDKKDKKATVKIWFLNSKDKVKGIKVKKKNATYANKKVSFSGDGFEKDEILVGADGKPSKVTASANAAK